MLMLHPDRRAFWSFRIAAIPVVEDQLTPPPFFFLFFSFLFFLCPWPLMVLLSYHRQQSRAKHNTQHHQRIPQKRLGSCGRPDRHPGKDKGTKGKEEGKQKKEQKRRKEKKEGSWPCNHQYRPSRRPDRPHSHHNSSTVPYRTVPNRQYHHCPLPCDQSGHPSPKILTYTAGIQGPEELHCCRESTPASS